MEKMDSGTYKILAIIAGVQTFIIVALVATFSGLYGFHSVWMWLFNVDAYQASWAYRNLLEVDCGFFAFLLTDFMLDLIIIMIVPGLRRWFMRTFF